MSEWAGDGEYITGLDPSSGNTKTEATFKFTPFSRLQSSRLVNTELISYKYRVIIIIIYNALPVWTSGSERMEGYYSMEGNKDY